MQIVTQNELVSINATLVVQAISFLIFLFLIERVMFRPLRRTAQERRGYLRDMEQEATRQERQLVEMTRQVEEEAQALKQDAFRESERLEATGKQEANGLMAQARSEMAIQQKKDTEQIRRRSDLLRQQLASEVEPLVAAMIAKVLDRRPEP